MEPILYPKNKIVQLFNNYRREAVLGTALFLVASLSFGLGFIMGTENEHAPIIIQKQSQD